MLLHVVVLILTGCAILAIQFGIDAFDRASAQPRVGVEPLPEPAPSASATTAPRPRHRLARWVRCAPRWGHRMVPLERAPVSAVTPVARRASQDLN